MNLEFKGDAYGFPEDENPKRPRYDDTNLGRIDDIKYIFKDRKEAEQFVDNYQALNNSRFSVYKTESGFNVEGKYEYNNLH